MDQNLSELTILAVDDTPANIDVVKGVLSDSYFVQAAVNGKMALKIIEKKKPDLILLDIIMPEMDGYEVCRRLKADETTRDIPIIFLTAKVEEVDETKGLKLGAVDYITKPISPPILISRIQTHLRIKEANDVLKQRNKLLEENTRLREDVECITQHDMKSPLAAILGFSQLMRFNDNLTEKQVKYIDAIESSAHKLLDMMNLHLDLYKMEQGTYEVKTESVDLSPHFASIIEESKLCLKSKGLVIDTFINGDRAVDGEEFIIQSENLLVYSMLSNLFKNAIEASPIKERITISMEDGETKSVSMRNMGAVPEEIRDTFFEKYATAGKSGGTGLGTYSARLFAEIVGGKISLDTAVENETTIRIEFTGNALQV